MIKANELRVGNLVYDFIKGETRVETIEDYDFPDRAMLERIQPIPLTEEWLENFGFECASHSGGNSIYYSIGDFGGELLDGFFQLTWYEFAPCQYVHQLQNLYFALTGEELELKPESK